MRYLLTLCVALAGCAAGPQPCIVAHSPSVTINGVETLPSQTTRVCPAYVTVDAQ